MESTQSLDDMKSPQSDTTYTSFTSTCDHNIRSTSSNDLHRLSYSLISGCTCGYHGRCISSQSKDSANLSRGHIWQNHRYEKWIDSHSTFFKKQFCIFFCSRKTSVTITHHHPNSVPINSRKIKPRILYRG